RGGAWALQAGLRGRDWPRNSTPAVDAGGMQSPCRGDDGVLTAWRLGGRRCVDARLAAAASAGGLMAATGGRGNGDGSAPTLNQDVLRRRRRLSAPALQAYSSSNPRTRTGDGSCDVSSRVPVPSP